jgi:small multidrug resistance family-3 protein
MIFEHLCERLDTAGVAYRVTRHEPVFTSEEAARVRGASLASGLIAKENRHGRIIPVKTYAWYVLAAFAEIGGCFAFWVWLRQTRSILWLLPGMMSLALFAFALTRVDSTHAGRAYAAYGGIYIVASIFWLWAVEKARPDKWDALGATICILGSLVILFGRRVA